MKFILVIATLLLLAQPAILCGQFSLDIDIESDPFQYTATADNNRVSRLIEKLKSKELKLEYTNDKGYLQSLLKALDIHESSQTLVFSKTSLQVRYISRRNPRAIYFNEDTYLGWVNGSSLAELSTTDPKPGAVFYTVDMMPWRPKIARSNYDCLGRHATSMTQGVPGHTVRSVMPMIDGSVHSQKESFITDDRSPFSQRWGGWFVSGQHGAMKHLGNEFLRDNVMETSNSGNRASLINDFDTSNYLSPYSDIVALMVLEHQTQMHNAMTRANFYVRQLLYDQQQNPANVEADEEWPKRLELIAKEVVDRALFCDEERLTDKVSGSKLFAKQFVSRGPHDAQGRSLREFDLETRLFKYPCSYLIQTPAFEQLEPCLREEITRQIRLILSGDNLSKEYAHLVPETRITILEILGW